MVKMIMHGCNGRMGHVIVDLCKEDNDIQLRDVYNLLDRN